MMILTGSAMGEAAEDTLLQKETRQRLLLHASDRGGGEELEKTALSWVLAS